MGLESVEITHRYLPFEGTEKEAVTQKFGVIGINVSAVKPLRVEEPDSVFERGVKLMRGLLRRPRPVKVGDEALEIELPATSGARYRLSDDRGRHVLLFFLPGDWCPVCHLCFRVYRDEADRMAKQGVRLVLVNTKPDDSAHELAESLGLDHVILVDPEAEVAEKYGVLQQYKKKRDSAIQPTSFLIDPEGRVICRSELDSGLVCIERQNLTNVLDASEQKEVVGG